MRVIRLESTGYRNLIPAKIEAHEGINIIYGDNAQGKTNLIEGIWLFTGAKSFRGSKDGELTQFGSPFSRLSLDFYGGGREQNAEIRVELKRRAILNGIELKSPSNLAGNFCAVIFSPVHLSLIKDGPVGRRKFLDSAIGQMWPKYIDILRKYTRAVAQRNAALKDLKYRSDLMDMINIFEHTIASFGGKLTEYRLRYVEALKKYTAGIYDGLSGGKERLSLEYLWKGTVSGAEPKGNYAEILMSGLLGSRDEDMLTCTTSVGPHRDDLLISINDLNARTYGSQGQQRSAVLALKLSEAEVLKKATGEQPVALLDDVMSELDTDRQDYILNHIRDWQVFITCCDPSPLKRMTGGKIFHMSGGAVAHKEFE